MIRNFQCHRCIRLLVLHTMFIWFISRLDYMYIIKMIPHPHSIYFLPFISFISVSVVLVTLSIEASIDSIFSSVRIAFSRSFSWKLKFEHCGSLDASIKVNAVRHRVKHNARSIVDDFPHKQVIQNSLGNVCEVRPTVFICSTHCGSHICLQLSLCYSARSLADFSSIRGFPKQYMKYVIPNY